MTTVEKDFPNRYWQKRKRREKAEEKYKSTMRWILDNPSGLVRITPIDLSRGKDWKELRR